MFRKIYFFFSRRPEILLGLIFGYCLFMLGIQTPYLIFSPDVTIYSSTIIRAMHYEFFIEPFSGTYSIVPAFYGTIFGIINSILHLNIVRLLWGIEIFCFLGFFLLYLGVAYVISEDRRIAVLMTLASGLVLYHPTGRYFLLPGLYNFGILFFLVALLFFIQYLVSEQKKYLIFFCFFSGFAIATWWYFIVFPVVLVLTTVFLSQYRITRIKHLLYGALGFIPPGLFIAWHLYTIRNVLSLYVGVKINSSLSFFDMAGTNLFALLTRDNRPISQIQDLIPDAIYLFNTLIGNFIYYFLVIPSSLLFLLFPIVYLFYKKFQLTWLDDKKRMVFLILMISGYILILLSFFIDPSDTARVARNQFVGYILLSFCCFVVLFSRAYPYRKILRSVLICCSIIILIYISSHGTDLIIKKDTGFFLTSNYYNETQVYSGLDTPIIELLENLSNRDNSRIFLSDIDIMILAPQVPLRSFHAHRNGLYDNQDPITARDLDQKYDILAHMKENWYDVIREENITYMIFTTNMRNYDMVSFYSSYGTVVISNQKWVVIDMSKKSDEDIQLIKK